VLSLRVSRDKRGYDHIYLLYESRRKGRPVTRLVYGGRWPSPMRVGQPPLDEATRRTLEQAHPDISFDWHALQRTLQQALSLSRAPAPPDRDRRRRPGAAPSMGAPAGPSDAGSRARSGGRGSAPPARPAPPPSARPGARGPSSQGPERHQAPGYGPPHAPAAAASAGAEPDDAHDFSDDLAAASRDPTGDPFEVSREADEGEARSAEAAEAYDAVHAIHAYETPAIEVVDFRRGADLDRVLDPGAFDDALVAGPPRDIDVEVEQTFVVVANGEAGESDEVGEADAGDTDAQDDERDPVEVVDVATPPADPWSAVMSSLQEQSPASAATSADLPPSGLDLSGRPGPPRTEGGPAWGDRPRRRRRRRGGRRTRGDQPLAGGGSAPAGTADAKTGADADRDPHGGPEADEGADDD